MILISAGHYPEAPGACYKNECEHETAMEWAKALVDEISKVAPCLLVPTGGLREKVNFINTHSPIMAIEIHFNSSADGKGRGFETLYYPGSRKGALLATVAQDSMAGCLEHNRGIKEGWYKMDRPGIVDYWGDVDGDETPDYFLRKTRCPAIIIEPGFIQNMETVHKNAEYVIEALADALLAHYEDV